MAAVPRNRGKGDTRTVWDLQKFERFRAEYLAHGNAFRAALAAGYSERMAHSKGWKLAKRARAAKREAIPTAQNDDKCPHGEAERPGRAEVPTTNPVDKCLPPEPQQEAQMLRNVRAAPTVFLPRRRRLKTWIYHGPRIQN